MQQFDTVRISAAPRNGPVQTLHDFIRSWFSGRRGVIIGGIAIVAAGLALGWNWLTAIGAAPIILSLAPCAAMCALGACAMMRGNSSCAKSGSLDPAKPPQTTSAPAQSGEQEP
jgi:hypothetical protein